MCAGKCLWSLFDELNKGVDRNCWSVHLIKPLSSLKNSPLTMDIGHKSPKDASSFKAKTIVLRKRTLDFHYLAMFVYQLMEVAKNVGNGVGVLLCPSESASSF